MMLCLKPSRPPLVLASASPRRVHLLRGAGVEIEVVEPHGAEPEWTPGDAPREFALGAAVAKASWVARRHPGRLVLGADTVVALGDRVLGKPADEAEAAATLTLLSGRSHQVHTGVALVTADGDVSVATETAVVTTTVEFRRLTHREIEAYAACGEPLDKAGAYGIQGRGGELVAGYDGSYTNVVGLPVETVLEMLDRSGVTS